MKRKIKLSVMMLLSFMLVFSSVTVFGAKAVEGLTPIAYPANEATAVKAIVEKYDADKVYLEPKAGETLTNSGVLVKSTNDGVLQFNSGDFAKATERSKKRAVKSFITIMQESNLDAQVQQNLFDSMAGADKELQAMMLPLIFDNTSADLYTAMKWVSPILQVFRVVLGIGAIVLIALIFLSTVLDCAYIGIPMARGNKEGGSGNDKPFGISYDAISVVKEVESSLDGNNRYKNPYFLYFIRRSTTYIVLVICILYLVVGELSGLMSWLLSLGSGVVG